MRPPFLDRSWMRKQLIINRLANCRETLDEPTIGGNPSLFTIVATDFIATISNGEDSSTAEGRVYEACDTRKTRAFSTLTGGSENALPSDAGCSSPREGVHL